jgi:hypothetical protein
VQICVVVAVAVFRPSGWPNQDVIPSGNFGLNHCLILGKSLRGRRQGRGEAMNLVRLAAIAAILTTLSVGCAAAKPAVVSSDVNLRKGPGTDSEVITLIPKGTKVEVGTCTNDWCQVSWNGMDGYSIATNLGLGTPLVRRPVVGQGEYPPDAYPPPPGYVVGPPVYYGPGPYYGYGPYYGAYYGPGWRGRRRW